MKNFYSLLALCSMMSMHALSPLDDLFIKNNSDKTLGIIWFVGDNYTETGMGNLMSPATLAPKGQQIPGAEPYFPNTDSKTLKKAALQSIMNTKATVTGALLFNMNNPDEQRLVKFADYVTGTVQRDGKTYNVNKMTIVAPPAYNTPTADWEVIKEYDVQPDTYNTKPAPPKYARPQMKV
jgi:hypothetical protein